MNMHTVNSFVILKNDILAKLVDVRVQSISSVLILLTKKQRL